MKRLLLLLIFAVPLAAQVPIAAKDEIVTDEIRNKIARCFLDFEQSDLPSAIGILNAKDFQVLLRKWKPSLDKKSTALTLLPQKRTYISQELLQDDAALEHALTHEIVHIRRFRLKLPQEERLVEEETQAILRARAN